MAASKMRSVVIMGIVSIAIAAFAAYLLFNYLRTSEQRAKEAIATDTLVVASQAIPIGSSIESNSVKSTDWPKESLPQGYFRSTGDVVGRVSIQTIQPGDPLTESKLAPKGGVAGVMSYKVKEGHRAMTVGVNQVAGVAGFITPGNFVDVILITRPPGQNESVSKIVLQNVPVLAVGQIIEQQKDGKPQVVPTVTLDVTPEDAENLGIASSEGKLQLVLRNVSDSDIATTRGATVTRVMGGVSAPAKVAASRTGASRTTAARPVMASRNQVEVEVWRGSRKTVETFEEGK